MARTSSALSAVSGALLWGTLGPVAATLDGDDRLAAGGIRLLLGALTLLALGAARTSRRNWGRVDLMPLLVGWVGVAGFQVAYFGAVGMSGVAVSTAIGIGLSPVFTGIWISMRTRRPPSIVWVTGTTIAVAGLVLLAFGAGAGEPVFGVGLALSVLTAACFSMQIGAIEVLATRHGDAAALAVLFFGGAALLSPVTAVTATSGLLVPQNMLWVLYLGAVPTGLSYWLVSRGVRDFGAATATTISLLEPVGAAVIAAVVLGERIAPAQWVGIGAICAAVLAISLDRPRRPDVHQDDGVAIQPRISCDQAAA